jgi:hypothetical protein
MGDCCSSIFKTNGTKGGCNQENFHNFCNISFFSFSGAVLCVTLLDRLHGDQINTPHDIMEEWQARPQRIVAAYIKKTLRMDKICCKSYGNFLDYTPLSFRWF